MAALYLALPSYCLFAFYQYWALGIVRLLNYFSNLRMRNCRCHNNFPSMSVFPITVNFSLFPYLLNILVSCFHDYLTLTLSHFSTWLIYLFHTDLDNLFIVAIYLFVVMHNCKIFSKAMFYIWIYIFSNLRVVNEYKLCLWLEIVAYLSIVLVWNVFQNFNYCLFECMIGFKI